jgi:hypothetical protein
MLHTLSASKWPALSASASFAKNFTCRMQTTHAYPEEIAPTEADVRPPHIEEAPGRGHPFRGQVGEASFSAVS